MYKSTVVYLYLNGNQKTPSTRLRWLNFLDEFKLAGLDIRVVECGRTISERRSQIDSLEKGASILVQKKLLGYGELKRIKARAGSLYLDVDDAIWRTHPHKGNPYVNFLKKVLNNKNQGGGG